MRNMFVCWLLCIVLYSCKKQQRPFSIHEGSFTQAIQQASKEKKFLVAQLTMPGCDICKDHREYIKQNNDSLGLDRDFVFFDFNASDPRNAWIEQVIFDKSYPNTLVFDSRGSLVTLIRGGSPGVMYKYLNYVRQGNDSMYDRARTALKTKGKLLVTMLGKLFTAYQAIHRQDASEAIIKGQIPLLESTLKQESWFFNNYLLAKIYHLFGDSANAHQYASAALAHRSVPEIMIYAGIRPTVQKILNPDFSPQSTSILRFEKSNLDYGRIILTSGNILESKFRFRNIGSVAVKLDSVLLSCECVSYELDKRVIPPGDSGMIRATFNLHDKGPFYQSLTIISDAYNNPQVLSVTGTLD